MPLDKASEEKVCKWLSSKGQLTCPLCQGKAWGIGDMIGATVVATPLTSAALNPAGAPVSLMVQVTCINCAYTLFFAAPQMGITSLPKPAPAQS